jgi:RHS repeat-associated protein
VYDRGQRRRVRKEFLWISSAWVQTNEIRYIYDGNLVVQERGGNNVPMIAYVRGLDLGGGIQTAGGIGGLLARHDHASQTTTYYHADGSGNITVMINASQGIVAKYLYDPFGNVLSANGPLADANLYRFSSKEVHLSSGLIYFGLRFYEPALQRWLNRSDCRGGGINLFSLSQNSPISSFDAWGLDPDDLSDFFAPRGSFTSPTRGEIAARTIVSSAYRRIAVLILDRSPIKSIGMSLDSVLIASPIWPGPFINSSFLHSEGVGIFYQKGGGLSFGGYNSVGTAPSGIALGLFLGYGAAGWVSNAERVSDLESTTSTRDGSGRIANQTIAVKDERGKVTIIVIGDGGNGSSILDTPPTISLGAGMLQRLVTPNKVQGYWVP